MSKLTHLYLAKFPKLGYRVVADSDGDVGLVDSILELLHINDIPVEAVIMCGRAELGCVMIYESEYCYMITV